MDWLLYGEDMPTSSRSGGAWLPRVKIAMSAPELAARQNYANARAQRRRALEISAVRR
jgi:hypothetical protein